MEKIKKAFLDCYDEYADAVFRYCYFRVYEREKAQELMQEAFMKTWKYLAEGHRIENIRAFVYKTAKHLIIDYHRKKKEESLDELSEKGFTPSICEEAKWQAAIDGKELLSYIEALDEGHKEVFYLRYVDQLQPKEIAELLGESPNVISVRISRAKKQFLSCIKHLI